MMIINDEDLKLIFQVSMPGMMDTVLNLGLNDDVVEGLAKKSGERFAYDSYRRFIDMFGDVVGFFLVMIYNFSGEA